MRRPFSLSVRLLLLGLSLPLIARAQQDAVQQEPIEGVFTGEVEVTEVLLDVVVTDKQDRIIVGLGLDDFVVSEDGQRVPVTSATFYSSRQFLGSAEPFLSGGAGIETVPQDRYFILFVQDEGPRKRGHRIPPVDHQRRAGRQFVRWLMEDVQLADRVAVVSFRGRLEVYQDFTTDREALFEAIGRAAREPYAETIPPSRSARVAGDPPVFGSLPTGNQLRRESKDIHHALRLVAGAVKDVPGRKNLIFLGRGFGDSGAFGRYYPAPSKLKPTLKALNDANVVVYSLDVTPYGEGRNLEASLRALAVTTGGQFFHNRQTFTDPLRKIADVTSGYYLLSYQSQRPASDPGYQRVEVGVRNPELRIQAREGYFYGPSQTPD